MPNNYILLETIALTQSAASVTFDNLPTSGYTDLKIVVSARSTANGGQNMNLTFNSNTSGYSDRILSGNGSAASSFTSGNTSRGGSCVMPGADFTANTFGNGEIYIPNYRGSNAKSFSSDSVSENNATLSYNQMQATLWNNSAAITNILIDLSGGSFAAGSTFSLYGIAALGTTPVLAPKATGGNIVANDGTYWYHAFTSSGNFVPQVGLTADVLVVAGGGGGGNLYGGGGGAGGVLQFSSQSLTPTTYNCTIGAGGTGAPTISSAASVANGVNSQFASLTVCVAGGGGASNDNATPNGAAGGSGGGAAGTGAGVFAGGTATSGQGNAGGINSNSPSSYGSGGGGGSGAVGGAGTSSAGGAGGAGLNTWSSWLSATSLGVSGFIAGGGGGGTFNNSNPGAGGSGGGGAAGTSTGNNATVNTGSGGGGGGATGSGNSRVGGNGGSGIILIRYPIN